MRLKRVRATDMKKSSIFILASLGTFLLLVIPWATRAETGGRSLTLIYSNNINGEIEPCPT